MSEGDSRVALVLVSHSPQIAEGARELAAAMAPDVHIGAAGGDPEGGLGSSFDLIEKQIGAALESSGGRGVAVLTDLGSATLTVESAIEFSDSPQLVRYAPGPLVEGAVAASIAAQVGGDLDEVVLSVNEIARNLWEEGFHPALPGTGKPTHPAPEATGEAEPVELKAIVADAAGLHARPAAKIANLASGFDAQIWVNDVRSTSPIQLVALGVAQGETVTVRATGPDALEAASRIAQGISAGLDA